MANIEYSRLLMKRSMTSGVVPTVPLTNNLNDFTTTDIFEGELFYNVADGILYSRDLTGIVILASGIVPPPTPDLTTVLGIGNNTGPFDIIVDTDQVVRNPLGLTPLESALSFGVSTAPGVTDNYVQLTSEDTTLSRTAGLRLTSQDSSGFTFATIGVNDGAGTTANISLYTDALSGFNLFDTSAPSGASSAIVSTPTGGFLGINSILGNDTFIWNSQPSQYDWSVSNPVTIASITEVNDLITGSRRDVTSSSTTNYIEQNLGGKIDLYAFDSAGPGLAQLTLDPTAGILSSLLTSGAAASKIDMYANGLVDIFAGDAMNLTMTPGKFSINTLPAFDDDAAAGAGGLTTNSVYQTTGLGAAPLNVPGIVMIKQ